MLYSKFFWRLLHAEQTVHDSDLAAEIELIIRQTKGVLSMFEYNMDRSRLSLHVSFCEVQHFVIYEHFQIDETFSG